MWLKWMRVYLDSRCVSCAVRSEWIRNPPLTQESDADARNNEAMWDVTPFGSPSETNLPDFWVKKILRAPKKKEPGHWKTY